MSHVLPFDYHSMDVVDDLLTVDSLGKLIHKSAASVRSDASRNPDALPPICRLPGNKRLLWRRKDVMDWIASFVQPSSNVGSFKSLEPEVVIKRRGRPRKRYEFLSRIVGPWRWHGLRLFRWSTIHDADYFERAAAQEGNLSATGGDKSSNLRVAGEVRLKGQSWIVVVDDAGAVRLENPSAFVGQGTLIVGSVEGKRVATWTGGRSGSPTITGVQK